MNTFTSTNPHISEEKHGAIEEFKMELREKAFREISHYRSKMFTNGATNRVNSALNYAMLMFALVVALSFVLWHFDVVGSTANGFLIGMVASFAVYVLCRKYSPAEDTHGEYLDKLLSTYEPIDAQAFCDFQRHVVKTGVLVDEKLDEWIAAESAALMAAVGRQKLQFVQRSLSEGGPASPKSEEPAEAPPVNPRWIEHAYPLQQVTIRLQGTRHSNLTAIVAQLETVAARLKAGDKQGSDHDDDFGYAFEYIAESPEPTFFNDSAGQT